MRTGTAHIKTGVDTAKHSESGGILNMKMCPDIYTWVGTLHIATSGESAYYSVSGGDTAHEIMFKCSYWGGDTAQRIGGLTGWLALSVITVQILSLSCKLRLKFQDESSVAKRWGYCT